MGGAGAYLSDTKLNSNCEKIHPVSYVSTDLEGQYEGSGGASNIVNSKMGGSGGGIVWLTAAEKLTITDSNITSNG